MNRTDLTNKTNKKDKKNTDDFVETAVGRKSKRIEGQTGARRLVSRTIQENSVGNLKYFSPALRARNIASYFKIYDPYSIGTSLPSFFPNV